MFLLQMTKTILKKIYQKKAWLSACIFFLVTGCSDSAYTDLRKYIPSDAAMVGYLDCERLLEHADIASQPQLAATISDNIHHLLRSTGFVNKDDHFSNCYFFSYNSQDQIAIILNGKYVNQVISNLTSVFSPIDNITGCQTWYSGASHNYIVRLDDNTILLTQNMTLPYIAASTAGVGNNKLLDNLEKSENIAAVKSRRSIPCTQFRVKDFHLEIIETAKHVALKLNISPEADEDISELMSKISFLPLSLNTVISCDKTIQLYDPESAILIASGAENLQQFYKNNHIEEK